MKNPTCDTNVSKFAEIIPTVQVQNKKFRIVEKFFSPKYNNQKFAKLRDVVHI